MKNPNGFGSVVKLSGKRRKPFAARITTGWTNEGKQIFKYIGYYETRKEALLQLSLYSNNPYDLDAKKITLADIFERFIEIKKNEELSKSRIIQFNSFFKRLEPLHHFSMLNIKLSQLQTLFDSFNGISTGTLKSIKSFTGQLFNYALKLDIIEKNYAEFIQLPRHKAVIDRKVFTKEEIASLWSNLSFLTYTDVILILIYTGMRVNELLKLKKENIDLGNNTIIGGSKTEKGKNRIIPIHPKIQPLISARMNDNDDYYFISANNKSKHLTYDKFRVVFANIMEKLGMEYKW